MEISESEAIWDYLEQVEQQALRLCREKSGITVPLPAGAVITQLAEAGWEYYEYDHPHGSGDVIINNVQKYLDGDRWTYSADIVILMPAEYDNTPAGVHDGLRDAGHSRMVRGPHKRVYRQIF